MRMHPTRQVAARAQGQQLSWELQVQQAVAAAAFPGVDAAALLQQVMGQQAIQQAV